MPANERRCRTARVVLRALAAAVAAATFAIPGSAFAAEPPAILSAGIDAADHPYVTWRVGAGTTYDHVEFATAPTPDPDVPDAFVEGNVVAFGCTDTPEVCPTTPQSTSLTVDYALPRDRRYFVKVAATIDGTLRALMVSSVWVIDDAKPMIAGQPPLLTDGPPTNAPAVGVPLPGSKPVTVTQAASGEPPQQPDGLSGLPSPELDEALSLLALPKTISAVLARGVRLRVTCAQAPCAATASLMLGPVRLVLKRARIQRAGTRTLILKPTGAARRRLRGRARARLRVSAGVTPEGGITTRLSRAFAVRGRAAAKR